MSVRPPISRRACGNRHRTSSPRAVRRQRLCKARKSVYENVYVCLCVGEKARRGTRFDSGQAFDSAAHAAATRPTSTHKAAANKIRISTLLLTGTRKRNQSQRMTQRDTKREKERERRKRREKKERKREGRKREKEERGQKRERREREQNSILSESEAVTPRCRSMFHRCCWAPQRHLVHHITYDKKKHTRT